MNPLPNINLKDTVLDEGLLFNHLDVDEVEQIEEPVVEVSSKESKLP